jgi:hypothetical protein
MNDKMNGKVIVAKNRCRKRWNNKEQRKRKKKKKKKNIARSEKQSSKDGTINNDQSHCKPKQHNHACTLSSNGRAQNKTH